MAIGDLPCALTDQLEIDPCGIASNTITDTIHVRDDWFVTAYHESSSSEVLLISYEVTTAGAIPAAIQDSVTLSTHSGGAGSIGLVKVTTGVLALCFHDATNGPSVVTYTVDACGNFSCQVDSQDLNACVSATSVNNGLFPTKYSNVFMATFIETGGDGQLATVTIDTCGNIVLVEKLEFDTDTAGASKIWGVYTGQGDFHMIVYEDNTTNDGFSDSFTIDACGNIGCEADEHRWQATDGTHASAVKTQTDGTVVIVYGDPGSSADATTVDINACGTMSNNSVLAFGANTGDTTDVIPLDSGNTTFITVMNSRFDTIKVDACGAITTQDSLTSIAEVSQNGSLALHPGTSGTSGIVVGAGFEGACAKLHVYSLNVDFGVPAPDLTQPALPPITFLPFTQPTSAPSFAWFPGLDPIVPDGNLIAKLKAGGVL